MQKMRKAFTILFAFLLLVSMFAGCSKDDSDKDTARKTNASSGKEDASDKTTEEDKTQSPASTKAGDTIYFGQYEQDNDLANGKEKIAWRVLTVENDKCLLISEKILDAKPYQRTDEGTDTWELCTLRTWLNNEFYNSTFNSAERVKVLESTVVNSDNNPDTDDARDTMDHIFCLSKEEAELYFNTERDRMAKCTDYAMINGADFVDPNDEDYNELMDFDKKYNGSWWLRSPGLGFTGIVDEGGWASDDWFGLTYSGIGIRPALWIDL